MAFRRRLCRERKVLIAQRVQHVNRIKGLLFCQGVSGYKPLRRDRRRWLDELRTGDSRPLSKHLRDQIGRETDRLELLLEQIRAAETERNALLAAQRVAAPTPAAMLLEFNGIGPEFAAVLWLEGLFRHFGNRRQIASYAGLAPTPWQSGSVDHEQGVSKAGNPRLRTTLIQLACYGCAIRRNRRWLCGLKSGSCATAAVLRKRPSWLWPGNCWWLCGNMSPLASSSKEP
jgi:transposase